MPGEEINQYELYVKAGNIMNQCALDSDGIDKWMDDIHNTLIMRQAKYDNYIYNNELWC